MNRISEFFSRENRTVYLSHLEGVSEKTKELLRKIPIASVAFLVTGAVFNSFLPVLTPPLCGVGTSLLIGTPLLRSIDWKSNKTATTVIKSIVEFNKNYPAAQIIGIISTVALGILSSYLSFTVGIAYGLYSATLIATKQQTFLDFESKLPRKFRI